MGFITARLVLLGRCDAADRRLMGNASPLLNHEKAVYILTLGTTDACRKQV